MNVGLAAWRPVDDEALPSRRHDVEQRVLVGRFPAKDNLGAVDAQSDCKFGIVDLRTASKITACSPEFPHASQVD